MLCVNFYCVLLLYYFPRLLILFVLAVASSRPCFGIDIPILKSSVCCQQGLTKLPFRRKLNQYVGHNLFICQTCSWCSGGFVIIQTGTTAARFFITKQQKNKNEGHVYRPIIDNLVHRPFTFQTPRPSFCG